MTSRKAPPSASSTGLCSGSNVTLVPIHRPSASAASRYSSGSCGKKWKPGGGVVLAGPDRVKAERTNKAHLLQRFGETTGRIIASRVLRVQVDAKLQGHAFRRHAVSGDDGTTSRDTRS